MSLLDCIVLAASWPLLVLAMRGIDYVKRSVAMARLDKWQQERNSQ